MMGVIVNELHLAILFILRSFIGQRLIRFLSTSQNKLLLLFLFVLGTSLGSGM
jgi:hypothetical protein